MAEFIFIYHGGDHPASEEEGMEMMQKWDQWLADIKDVTVDEGKPMGISKTVLPDGSVEDHGGSNPASGYSVFTASNMDAALALAKSCPFLSMNGSIEVAESFEM